MYNDKQLVRITVFVLLVGIVLVYAVFFNTKGDYLIAQASRMVQERVNPDTDADTVPMTGNDIAYVSGNIAIDTGTVQSRGETTGTTMKFSGLEELFGGDATVYLGTGNQILSGTSLFQGKIDLLQTLGINSEYVLKDNTYNIYYVYIGRDKNYNLPEIAKEFGGKAIEVYKQIDIINNLYFGDRVTFVELPQYKDVKVNVFIQYGQDLWMIQDDASQYKQHKKYIRKLFTGK